MIALAGPSAAYDLEAWHDFAVAEVGAAAALAGLLVVAISINITRLLELPQVVSRLGRTLVLFGAILVTASLLLVPGQSALAAGIEIAVIGAVVAVLVGRVRGIGRLEPQFRRVTLLAVLLGATAAGLIAVGGVGLATTAIGGLYWLVAGILLAFVIGLLNAWVALVEILR